jgi:hypothetical protein
MNISRRKVKDSLMITNGYMPETWQARISDASAAVQTIDSQGLGDKFARWQSPEVSARPETYGGAP